MNLVEEKWIEILNRVKEEHEILDVSFDTWLAPLKVHEVEGNVEDEYDDNDSLDTKG